MDEISLKMTRADHQLLLKHVFIANWILTATKETRDKTLEDFNQKILKFMKTNQIEERIEKDKKQNLYFVSEDLENSFLEEIDSYNEDTFIEELIDQLTKKELVKTYTQEEVEGMNETKFNKIFDALQEKYIEEVGKNGMRNIEFVDSKTVS
jgi:uncharacterized membrane protein YheB (UPF0754 family)